MEKFQLVDESNQSHCMMFWLLQCDCKRIVIIRTLKAIVNVVVLKKITHFAWFHANSKLNNSIKFTLLWHWDFTEVKVILEIGNNILGDGCSMFNSSYQHVQFFVVNRSLLLPLSLCRSRSVTMIISCYFWVNRNLMRLVFAFIFGYFYWWIVVVIVLTIDYCQCIRNFHGFFQKNAQRLNKVIWNWTIPSIICIHFSMHNI